VSHTWSNHTLQPTPVGAGMSRIRGLRHWSGVAELTSEVIRQEVF